MSSIVLLVSVTMISPLLLTFQESLYNLNIFVNLILVPISLLGCYALIKHARIHYKCMQKWKQEPSSLERKYSIYNSRTIYIRDVFLCFISIDEGLQKFLEIIDNILLQTRESNYVLNPNISNTCTINPVSSLGFYYHRGPGYYFLYALINTTDIMLLVLLNALTIFLVKSYSEHPQWGSLKTFLILSMVAVVLILIITPIQYTLILGNISYSVVVLIQLIILFVQTKRLYFVLRQRKLEALSQKLSPRVIKYQKKLQGSFKYFSIFVITLLLTYYSGQWLDIFIVTVVGSVLENSCWFGHFFRIHYSIPFSSTAFQPIKLLAIYSQFVTLLMMNGTLLGLYIAYLLYSFYKGWTARKIINIRYTTVDSVELRRSLID